MIITIAGLPGAGKSTIKNRLAEHFGLKAYSIGDMRGRMARERGLTIDELNTLGMEQDFTDREVDEFQKKLGETEDDFVIDGWLSWRFIPHSFKIFLTCTPEEAARRIFKDRKVNPHREDEINYPDIETASKVIRERLEQTDARYQKWYGVHFRNQAHYDLVIDTTKTAANQVFAQIVEALQAQPRRPFGSRGPDLPDVALRSVGERRD